MPVQTQMQVRRGTASSWTSTNPTLAAGELGFETNTGKFKIGNGSSTWTALLYAGGGQSSLTTYQYTATAGQTTFSGADINSNTLAYTVGAIQVYLNGALLANTTDYAATNGTSVVLTGGAGLGDSLTIISFATFDVANTYTQAQADALFIADTIVDAKGDIIAATAADTVSRLAVGANNTVLTADSSTATGLKWSAPAAGGMTLLSTTTLSGASTTISSISGSYNNLQLVIRSYQPSTTAQLSLQINGNTGTVYGTQQNNSGTAGSFYGTSGRITENAITGVTRNGIVIDFIDYANASIYKPITSYAIVQDAATPTVGWTISKHLINDINAITSITLITSTGTMSGTALLYGVK